MRENMDSKTPKQTWPEAQASKIKNKARGTSSFFKVTLKKNNTALAVALQKEKLRKQHQERDIVYLQEKVLKLQSKLAIGRGQYKKLLIIPRDHYTNTQQHMGRIADLFPDMDLPKLCDSNRESVGTNDTVQVESVVPQTNVIVSSTRKGPEDTPLENLLSNTVSGRRSNTILVKVPGPEDSPDEQDSGSEASDTVSNSGHASNAQNGQNITLITLNSEDDYPSGTWLGDENNPEVRVRCPVSAADMLHITTNCRTAEKMALTLLDYLFHREVQAMSNLSGQGKHGKKQLDPLMIYGVRCHLFYKFGISESDWYRIKQSIDSKCRTAWRRKQRGQSLAVKSFSKRTPRSSGSDGGVGETTHIETATQQTLHYALANQQVQIHRIGEDGQVQVIPQGQLHIAQVPQGEEVQITQDSEGNLQIHQVHVGQDGQVLRGAQLIAVASADGGATAVEGSPLPPDIQVQYVQLAPVTDHTAAVQAAQLAPALQADMEVKEAIQGAIQGENGEMVQIVTSVAT